MARIDGAKVEKEKTIRRFSTELEIKALPLVGQANPFTGETIEKPYKSHDTSAKGRGLYVYVAKLGKTFRYDFTFNDKPQCLTLGKFGEVLTLAQARDRLLEAKGQIAQGLNPCQVKQQNKQAAKEQAEATQAAKMQAENTFAKVSGEWLEFWRNGKAENTITNISVNLNKYLLPSLAEMPIDQITLDDLLKIVRKIEADKFYATANRITIILGQIFNFCLLRNYIERSPVEHLKKLLVEPDTKENHFAATVESTQVAEMLHKIDTWLNDNPSCSIFITYAIRLLCILPLRINELLGLTWSEVDLEKAQISIGEERMKCNRPFIAYLSKQAVDILKQVKELPRAWLNDFVFQSTKSNTLIAPTSIRHNLEKAGISCNEQTLHGFRSTFSSLCYSTGAPSEVVEACLAHQTGTQVSRAYNRSNLEIPRRKLMQWYADLIDSLRNGKGEIKLDVSSLYNND